MLVKRFGSPQIGRNAVISSNVALMLQHLLLTNKIRFNNIVEICIKLIYNVNKKSKNGMLYR